MQIYIVMQYRVIEFFALNFVPEGLDPEDLHLLFI